MRNRKLLKLNPRLLRRFMFVCVGSIPLGALAFDVNAPGITAGDISKNVAASFFESVSAFEAFLYVLGVVFFIDFVRRARNHAKNSNNNGAGLQGDWVSSMWAMLILSACCFLAPTVLGSMTSTLFGASPTQSIQAPQPSFN